MNFQKCRSLKVSERVFDIVVEKLTYEIDNIVKVDGWIETFNNCREQGLVLFVDSTDYNNENRTKGILKIWACEARNSDEIMVITSTNSTDIHNMFDEDAYNNRKYFHYDEYQKAADYIVEQVKETFKFEFGNK